MTIPVECPSCHLSFQVDAAHAGKRARCRRCQTVFRVPAPAAMPDDPGLVPLDEEPDRPGRLERASTLERSPSSGPEDDDTPGYALAGGGPRRVKPVKVRSEALTGAGAGAKGVADAAAPTRRTLTPKQVLASLEGTIEPVRATFLYRLWIAIVAGVMVLLPLVYLAIVGLFAILVVYHAVNNVTILQTVGKGAGAAKFALFVYVAPLLAGVGVLGFMLKPLFARRQRGPENRVLDPEVEPLLYAFVDGICDTVGAPRPARIAVEQPGQRLGPPRGGALGRSWRRAGPDDRPADRGRADPQAVRGRARPRVRPLLAARGDAALCAHQHGQLVVCTSCVRARFLG